MKNGVLPDDLCDMTSLQMTRMRQRENKYVRRLQELQKIAGLPTKLSDTNWNELKLLFTELVNSELRK